MDGREDGHRQGWRILVPHSPSWVLQRSIQCRILCLPFSFPLTHTMQQLQRSEILILIFNNSCQISFHKYMTSCTSTRNIRWCVSLSLKAVFFWQHSSEYHLLVEAEYMRLAGHQDSGKPFFFFFPPLQVIGFQKFPFEKTTLVLAIAGIVEDFACVIWSQKCPSQLQDMLINVCCAEASLETGSPLIPSLMSSFLSFASIICSGIGDYAGVYFVEGP